MNIKALSVLTVAFMVAAFAMPFVAESCFAEEEPVPEEGGETIEPFTVTDGLGNEFTFNEPAKKIISIGSGATATVMGVGALDKIVVCDSYSKTNKADLFDPLRTKIEEGKIRANGNIYSSGLASLIADITFVSDDSTFDRENDIIIVCGSETYRGNFNAELDDSYKNVLQWNDITEYGDIVEFVKKISLVCTGGITYKAEQMEYATGYIEEKFMASHLPRAKAFYVTYSGGDYKVGNTGSLANSMILAAQGESVTVDPAKSGTTYGVGLSELTSIIEEHGEDTIVFIDNSIFVKEEYLNNVRSAVGDARIVPMEAIWNNYCIESIDGVWTMASALYPTVFEGDVPDVPPEEDDTVIFIVAGSIVAVIVGILGFSFIKRM